MWFHLPQWHNISYKQGQHHSDKTSVTKTTSSGLNHVTTSDLTPKNLAITFAINQKICNMVKIHTNNNKNHNIMKNIVFRHHLNQASC